MMRLIVLLFCVSSCLCCLSCGTNSEPEEAAATETSPQPAAVDVEKVASTQPAVSEEGTVVTAVYESAAVYAGKTEYAFTTIAGDQLLTSFSNFDTDNNPALPENMLEDDEDLEGPPGANPAMVGKTFKLYYDKQGKLLRIEQAD